MTFLFVSNIGKGRAADSLTTEGKVASILFKICLTCACIFIYFPLRLFLCVVTFSFYQNFFFSLEEKQVRKGALLI